MASELGSLMDSISIVDSQPEDTRPLPLRCPKCQVLFDTNEDLVEHQKILGHFACKECEKSFYDPATLFQHLEESHREKQNLPCVGCKKSFKSAGAWMHHIEFNQCNSIFASQIAARRQERLEFAQELEKRRQPSPEPFPWSHVKTSAPAAGHLAENQAPPKQAQEATYLPSYTPLANRVYYRPDDFPEDFFPQPKEKEFRYNDGDFPSLGSGQKQSLRGRSMQSGPPTASSTNIMTPPTASSTSIMSNAWTKQPLREKPTQSSPATASTTGTESNAWMEPKGLSPQYHNAVPPPGDRTWTEYFNARQFPAAPMGNDRSWSPEPEPRPTGRVTDPYDPNFNAAVFIDPILGTFKCPHGCKKKLETASGLAAHLKSPAHAGTAKKKCPGCNKYFTTTTALVSHMETSQKCRVRKGDDFRVIVSQVTGATLDFDPKNALKYGTERFELDKGFVADLQKTRSGEQTLGNTESKRIQKYVEGKHAGYGDSGLAAFGHDADIDSDAEFDSDAE
ncbi:hypothetical protein GGR56DRAFT_656913 [Xylariaceae sp. FL0804]|nr:hypothetical protein GGR56DRAFT_656913 [Xylariaceae sp. FL0804]